MPLHLLQRGNDSVQRQRGPAPHLLEPSAFEGGERPVNVVIGRSHASGSSKRRLSMSARS